MQSGVVVPRGGDDNDGWMMASEGYLYSTAVVALMVHLGIVPIAGRDLNPWAIL
ncbi:uncharacterized protein BO80DRAFT_424246 [Aspergillus ibericus CBS 121593]|uniref:Uncharacterized protein n=1 Tax=Aspergillus ibericus CBS 121593 TaxID=1448316 RepID=A0A395H1X9_9EURO|nr:hypothetical protein BO80DRAFT_424246 [Aspergillus ibericus CBS 121593]RAL01877.1 hypothetical protein BO80DRAFT_424246 [Aspergillus ibericus CBS 121593]